MQEPKRSWDVYLNTYLVNRKCVAVLKTRLVRARMDQAQRSVRVSSTMHRTFGRAQWQQLRGVLQAWRANVQQAHEAMKSVAAAQIEYNQQQLKA